MITMTLPHRSKVVCFTANIEGSHHATLEGISEMTTYEHCDVSLLERIKSFAKCPIFKTFFHCNFVSFQDSLSSLTSIACRY